MKSGWLVVDGPAGDPDNVHVVPTGDDGEPLPTHEPTAACPCQPKLTRIMPLDARAVVSHREPRHPGATVGPD